MTPPDPSGQSQVKVTVEPAGPDTAADEDAALEDDAFGMNPADDGSASAMMGMDDKLARWCQIGHGKVAFRDGDHVVVAFPSMQTARKVAAAFGGKTDVVDKQPVLIVNAHADLASGQTTAAFRHHVRTAHGSGTPGYKAYSVYAVRQGQMATKPIERVAAKSMSGALGMVHAKLAEAYGDTADTFSVFAMDEDDLGAGVLVMVDDDFGDAFSVVEESLDADIDYPESADKTVGDEEDALDVFYGEGDDGYYFKLQTEDGEVLLEDGPFEEKDDAKEACDEACDEWLDDTGVPEIDVDMDVDSDPVVDDGELSTDELIEQLLDGESMVFGASKISTQRYR